MKKYWVLIFVLVFSLSLGLSYAYFMYGIEGESELRIASKDLKVIFTDKKEITNLEIVPGWSDSKSFTVENKSNGTYNYNIVFTDLVNTFVTEGGLQYKIISDNGYNMTEWVDVPKSSSASDVILVYDIDIEVDEIQEYTIEFRYFDNPDVDQSEDRGKDFTGSLAIMEGSVDPSVKYSVILNVSNGTIDGESVTSKIKETVKKGSVTYEVAANTGYDLGASVTCTNGSTGVIEGNTVTISNVTINDTCTLVNPIKQYNIQVTSTNNDYGTVSPTSSLVNHGGSLTVNITPKSGYKYKSNSCGLTVTNNKMTFSNVTSDKECTVTFDKATLYDKILADHPTVKTRGSGSFDSVFGSSTATTGVIYKESTYRETGGNNNKDVYYFAGNVADNWVSFGGYMWRIIRTNEDGSVRLLYHGTSTTATDSYIAINTAYNDSYSNTMYVGYMYGTEGSISSNRTNTTSSNIKTVIDNWYKSNILSSYDGYVSKTAIYCNDRASEQYITSWDMFYAAYSRLNAPTRQPSYQCGQNTKGSAFISSPASIADKFSVSTDSGGNGKLQYGVALMTADEVSFAGGLYKSISSNCYYHLNSLGNSSTANSTWWTMSPISQQSYGINFFTYVSIVYDSGIPVPAGEVVHSGKVVRPVLSLKSCVSWVSGNGTASNPYKVSVDSKCSSAVN